MKHLHTALLLLVLSSSLSAQSDQNPNYDADLAAQLGGDDYGMKSYVFVILTSGEKPSGDDEATAEAFRGHFMNMDRLTKEGLLYVAGPFGTNDDDYRGLFILNVEDIDAAADILDTDPAIAGGYLAYRAYPWYGSAALGTYIDAHEKIWKKQS